jgi:putative hydrolase of HD superfamily
VTLPADELLALLDRAGDLKRLPRTGWLFAGVTQPESVAEHAFSATILAMNLAEAVNVDPVAEALSGPLDVARVVRLALLHDLGESLVTDLPKRSADLLGADAKHRAEYDAMSAVLDGLPWAARDLDLWVEYDAAATPEARIVKDADKLEMVHQALRYEEAGAAGLDEFWQGHRWHFQASAQLFEALRSRRKFRTL